MSCECQNLDWRPDRDGNVDPVCPDCGRDEWDGEPCPRCGEKTPTHQARAFGQSWVCKRCRRDL